VVDFRSDWALCCCCLLSLCFRTVKTFAVASLSHRKHLLSLRFRTENIRCAAGSRANRCFLRESVVQRSDSNSTDVGHEGVITGRDGFSLRSSITDPQGVAKPPLQSTYPYPHDIRFKKMILIESN